MNKFSNRKFIVGIIFLIIGLIFIIRLFNIQIINEKYKADSNKNALRELVEYPVRGLIYDRNGDLLVYNEAAYDIMVVPRRMKEMDTVAFCDLLGIDKAYFIEKIQKAKKYSRYKPSVFEKEISAASYAAIQEHLFKYAGFFVQTRTLRRYPRKSAAHVLGYIGEVNQKNISQDAYYKAGDYIGKSGLEQSYENLLRGKRGVKRVLVDVHNREMGAYKGGRLDTLAVPGKTIHTTLSIDLQEYGEALMQNKRGAIVAIEPATGEILSMVSAPNYDPNMLVGRAVKRNFPLLRKDTLKPLFNRALMAQYPPGSIFKAIQALIGMQDGVISSSSGFPCTKSLVGCHDHLPAQNVSASLKYSCNPYYYHVFKRIIQKGKYDNIYKDSEIGLKSWNEKVNRFGLGQRLKTDFRGIKKGYIPDVGFYDRWYGEGRWAFSTIYSLSIGQGEVSVVPIQMANLAAIIANRGYYYTPHFIKSIEQVDTIPSVYLQRNDVGIDEKHYASIIDGMSRVINEDGGTARRARIENISVCGKTGTAQNPHGEDHSIFIAFAPKDNPKIAIAVYVENAGFGGTWAAPIASLMIEQYLTNTISNKAKETRVLEANLINVPIED